MSEHVHPPIQFPPHNTHMQALRSEEREREKEWDRRRVAEAKAGLVLESQLEKKQRDLRKKLAEENRQLAAEQRAKLVYIALRPSAKLLALAVTHMSDKSWASGWRLGKVQ